MHFINRSTWSSTQHYTITTAKAPSMRVTFDITYLCVCFIKTIVLAPSSECFSNTPHIYLRVLSFICAFLALRMGVKTLYSTINGLQPLLKTFAASTALGLPDRPLVRGKIYPFTILSQQIAIHLSRDCKSESRFY